jgi:hypothetical protein
VPALLMGAVGLVMVIVNRDKSKVWHIVAVVAALLAVTINVTAILLMSKEPTAKVAAVPLPPAPVEPAAIAPPADTSVDDALRVLRQSYKATRAGDAQSALRDAIMPDEQTAALAEQAITQMAAMMNQGQVAFDIHEGQHQGDWVLIVTSMTMNAGEQSTKTLQQQFMLQQDKQWKIVNDLVMAHPQVAPHINEDYQALQQWYAENQTALQDKYGAQSPQLDPSAMSAIFQTTDGKAPELDISALAKMGVSAPTGESDQALIDSLKQAITAANDKRYDDANQLIVVNDSMAAMTGGPTGNAGWDSITRDGTIDRIGDGADQLMGRLHQIKLSIHYNDGTTKQHTLTLQQTGEQWQLMTVQ